MRDFSRTTSLIGTAGCGTSGSTAPPLRESKNVKLHSNSLPFNLVAPKIFLKNSILLARILCNKIHAMGSPFLKSDMVQKQGVNIEENRA